MIGVIMAGGRGTRARPFTDHFPKAMMPAGGRPVIEHVINHMDASDAISDIVIIADLGGMGAQIRHRYAGYGSKPITFVQDSGSGTGGDLRHADIPGDFLLWFCDNLCALDIWGMAERYRESGAAACMAVRSRRPEETGFAEVSGGMVVRFQEKPVLELPYCECLGMYILGQAALDRIRDMRGPVNLSYDILQDMASEGGVAAYDIGGTPWLDAESPAVLERNGATVRSIISAMGARGPARTRI